MKMNSRWKLDDLITYLTWLKSSDLFDYHCTPMVWGELHFENGDEILEIQKETDKLFDIWIGAKDND